MTTLKNVMRMLPPPYSDMLADAFIADRLPYMSSNAQNLLRNSIAGKSMTANQRRQLKGYLDEK